MLRLDFTDAEMELFLKIYSIWDMVYEAERISEENYDPANVVKKLEKKILTSIEKSDYKKFIKRWGDGNKFISPINDLELEAEEIIDDYRTSVIFNDLPVMLGQRDMRESWDDKKLLWGWEDFAKDLSDEDWIKRDKKLSAYYEKYEKEFEENDIQNLRIVKNPLFMKK